MPEHGRDAAVWRAGEFMEFDRASHLVALRVRAPRGNLSSEPTGFDILYVRATSPALDTSRVSQDSATVPRSRPLFGCYPWEDQHAPWSSISLRVPERAIA